MKYTYGGVSRLSDLTKFPVQPSPDTLKKIPAKRLILLPWCIRRRGGCCRVSIGISRLVHIQPACRLLSLDLGCLEWDSNYRTHLSNRVGIIAWWRKHGVRRRLEKKDPPRACGHNGFCFISLLHPTQFIAENLRD